MDCRRIEELIPLFVEDDLDAEAMQKVSNHLNACAVCSQLVSEYSASQAWLRTYEVPEFDKRFFSDLQKSVMREIEQQQSRPSWLQRLAERWQQNPVFAMALVMLILAGAFVFAMYEGRTKVEPPDEVISDDRKPQDNAPQKVTEPVAGTSESRTVGNRRAVKHYLKRVQPRPLDKIIDEPLPVVIQQSLEPLDSLAINIFEDTSAIKSLDFGEVTESQMQPTGTRIEFQTSDPNIRIIWFAPKSNSSQSSKIDTE